MGNDPGRDRPRRLALDRVQTEDGDDYAVTAACPDDDIPDRTDFDGLCDRGPLRVVFNGDASAAAWPAANREQEATV
ncbi:hypothetical protein [Kribbella sp. NBC_00889]|uniref:hypothetical protein n=1 Tax=Kribbella sp. NBC_00889 TaxID=2975974 RepID=UPI00386C1AA5|nr:hypothetical protein OG817_13800 [Kribbella sp. NBC_00889]